MKVKNVLLWVVSVFLLLVSLGGFLNNAISGILILLSAIGCNPLFLKQLEKISKKPKKRILIPVITVLFIAGIAATPTPNTSSSATAEQVKEVEVTDVTEKAETETTEVSTTSNASADSTATTEQSTPTEQATAQADSTETTSEVQPTSQEAAQEETIKSTSNANTISTMDYNGVTYTIIDVDGGDRTGTRQGNVAVDIGYGDRVYWAFTNEYGQLVNVTADQVTLQDDSSEKVNSDGRYYDDEAEVPGTEQEDLDQGHVIADSLGGVANAYNITPQNSTLNRNGDQAYMEKIIRDAGGCENFVATITYADTTTQIPSHYHFEYDLMGNHVVDDFDNVNPDAVNAASASTATSGSDSSSNTASVAAVAGTAESTTTTQETTAVEQTEQVADNTEQTSIEVHITETGSKYHSAGCRYLKKSDKVTTLDNAKALGLEPCSVCNPPQ